MWFRLIKHSLFSSPDGLYRRLPIVSFLLLTAIVISGLLSLSSSITTVSRFHLIQDDNNMIISVDTHISNSLSMPSFPIKLLL